MQETRMHVNGRAARSGRMFLIGILVGGAAGFGLSRTTWFAREATQAVGTLTEESGVMTFAGGKGDKTGNDLVDELLGSEGQSNLDHARQMLAFVDSVKAGELEAQLNEVFARRKGDKGYELIGKLYAKWVQLDRASALQHAESLEGKNRKSALTAVLNAWAADEPREVIKWLQEHEKEFSGGGIAYNALKTIAEKDPLEAIAVFEANGRRMMPNYVSGFIHGVWAEKDPEAAAAHALTISGSTERNNALRALTSEWASSAPGDVWRWANGLERSTDRNAVLKSLVGQIASNEDPDRAIEFLDKIPPGRDHDSALEAIVISLSQFDPERAYQLARDRSLGTENNQAVFNVFYQWSQKDPETAYLTAVNEMQLGNNRNQAIQYSLSFIAKRDIEKAMKLFDTLEDETKGDVLYSVAREITQTDPSAAVAWADSLPNNDFKETAFSTVLSLWAESDPSAAASYGLNIENKSLRLRSLSGALSSWAQKDSVEAVTWAVKKLSPEDQGAVIPGEILGVWVRQDVKEASEWVGALPDGALREKSVPSLISSWADQDLVSAGEWLKQLPKGKTRDMAAERYASRVYNSDPEAALAWAESIEDEPTRIGQLEGLSRRYLRHEPDKAKRWIGNSSLPPEKKAELLNGTKKP